MNIDQSLFFPIIALLFLTTTMWFPAYLFKKNAGDKYDSITWMKENLNSFVLVDVLKMSHVVAGLMLVLIVPSVVLFTNWTPVTWYTISLSGVIFALMNVTRKDGVRISFDKSYETDSMKTEVLRMEQKKKEHETWMEKAYPGHAEKALAEKHRQYVFKFAMSFLSGFALTTIAVHFHAIWSIFFFLLSLYLLPLVFAYSVIGFNRVREFSQRST